MPKGGKHTTGLRAFLDARGLLENGSEEQIRAARREYRKIYLTVYKKKQRKESPEFSVLLSRQNGEYSRVTAAARRHKLSVPAFLKSATLAYINKTFIVPDREMIVKLAALLAECLNDVQQIATGKEKNYWLLEQRYDAIEKRVMDLEMQITHLLSTPLGIEDAVRSAIDKDSDLRLRLLLLLTSAPNATQS
jgi:hypothetical protein